MIIANKNRICPCRQRPLFLGLILKLGCYSPLYSWVLGNAGEMDEVKMWSFTEKPLRDQLHKVMISVSELESASGQAVFQSIRSCPSAAPR